MAAPINVPTFADDDFAEIAPASAPYGVSFRLFQDLFVPRPVFLVSTVSRDGVNNVAPFSFVSPCGTAPAMLMVSILRRDNATEKDTLVNARDMGEFVINGVTANMVAQANACAQVFPRTVSEFDFTGLTPRYSTSLAPYVAQSPFRLECSLDREIVIGGPQGGSMLLAVVNRAFVHKAAYRGLGETDVATLHLVGRCGITQFMVADDMFEPTPYGSSSPRHGEMPVVEP